MTKVFFLQAVLETVRRAYPQDKPFSIRLPRTPQQTYLMRMNNAHDLLVYADPYSGKILGAHRQEDTFTGWIALLHTQLLSGERGEIILGIGAVLLAGMGVTGLILWWPRNGKLCRALKSNGPLIGKKLILICIAHRASMRPSFF